MRAQRAQTAADGARGHATIFAGLGARHQDSLNSNFAPTYRAKRGFFFSSSNLNQLIARSAEKIFLKLVRRSRCKAM